LAVCQEKISYEEITKKLEISNVALRKYLQIIRKKLLVNNFDHYCDWVQFIPDFDLSLLWQNTREYDEIKEQIKLHQEEEKILSEEERIREMLE